MICRAPSTIREKPAAPKHTGGSNIVTLSDHLGSSVVCLSFQSFQHLEKNTAEITDPMETHAMPVA